MEKNQWREKNGEKKEKKKNGEKSMEKNQWREILGEKWRDIKMESHKWRDYGRVIHGEKQMKRNT